MLDVVHEDPALHSDIQFSRIESVAIWRASGMVQPRIWNLDLEGNLWRSPGRPELFSEQQCHTIWRWLVLRTADIHSAWMGDAEREPSSTTKFRQLLKRTSTMRHVEQSTQIVAAFSNCLYFLAKL
eukprot:TRINITY_DN19090_c0_g2_i1.p1 TRINITY_DN19090_c0_g2~~TRINITY_DN19090_c0_g2_i1.p1  ORF type:complete len:126 (-),score=15.20 TRINITY_DN19090_c0_g2_i1:201-578(-)